MKDIAEKLSIKEQEMAKQKGPFNLFALFLREGSPANWDLVVAADWIEEDKEEALKFLSKSIQECLSKDEIIKLSRIVIIDKDNPALEAFHKAMQVEHGVAEIRDSNFFGLEITHAFLITSNRGKKKTPNK